MLTRRFRPDTQISHILPFISGQQWCVCRNFAAANEFQKFGSVYDGRIAFFSADFRRRRKFRRIWILGGDCMGSLLLACNSRSRLFMLSMRVNIANVDIMYVCLCAQRGRGTQSSRTESSSLQHQLCAWRCLCRCIATSVVLSRYVQSSSSTSC